MGWNLCKQPQSSTSLSLVHRWFHQGMSMGLCPQMVCHFPFCLQRTTLFVVGMELWLFLLQKIGWLVQSRMQDILTSRSNNSGAGPRTAKIGRSISFSHSPYSVQFQIKFVPLFLTIGLPRIRYLISEWSYWNKWTTLCPQHQCWHTGNSHLYHEVVF